MSTITSGTELRHIQNRAYCRYDTENAEKIVHALDKGNVPHFARYNQQALSLTYDSSFQAVVDEIITKTESGDFEELLLEIQDRKNANGCRILVPEVADVLEMSVGAVNSRPDEMIDALCLAYIKLWHCDKATIKRELSEIIRVNNFIEEKEESVIRTLLESEEQKIREQERSLQR